MRIDDLAQNILESSATPTMPPVDVFHVAAALGIQIVEQPLIEDGRLERTSDGFRVLLKQDASIQRKRFTLAHELGHILLSGGALLQFSDLHPNNIERFCDALAASLLLPRDWLVATYGDSPRSLRIAQELSVRAHVSLAASVVRLNELLSWQRTLLRWQLERADEGRLGHHGWRLVSTVSVPPHLHAAIRSAPDTGWYLSEFKSRLAPGEPVEIPLLIRGRRTRVTMQLSARRHSVVALANLTLRVHEHTSTRQ